MKLSISHKTVYQYDNPVLYGLQQVRLTPKQRTGQKTLSWETAVEGGSREAEFLDQHDNQVLLISTDLDQTEISIISRGEIDTTDTHGIVGQHSGYVPLWLFQRPTRRTEAGRKIRTLVAALGTEFASDIDKLHALSRQISEEVVYLTGTTDSETTDGGAYTLGKGVCQDHAHIFISSARLLGFPARYVSGYLMMGDRIDQEATHAWAEAHVEGIGWVGFDVSNGISPDTRYVALATGLDYGDAAPISGLRLGDGTESMSVSLQVQQ